MLGTMIIQKTPTTFIFFFTIISKQKMSAKQVNALYNVSNTTFSVNKAFNNILRSKGPMTQQV